MDKINVGVVGAGRIGKIHIANMEKMPNVNVKMVADPFASELQEWFDSTKVEILTDNHEDIINDDDIDVVFICSPTDTHISLINAAAEKGKDVFCEKPISFSHEETLKTYELIKEKDVQVQIGFNRRFDKNFTKVRNLAKDEKLGDVHIVKITSRDPEAPSLDYVKSSGGMFFDMTIHDFDMARYLSSSEVTEVYAQGGALINPDITEYDDIDTAIITLKFENGAHGVIDNSREAVYGYDQRVEVFGSKGSAMVSNETETKVKLYEKDNVTEDNPLHFFLERYMDSFYEEVFLFFESLQNGTDVVPSYEDGMKAQQLAFAAAESYKTGKPVKIEKNN